MNQKTETGIPSDQKPPKEFARGFILTICLLTLVSLVGLYFVEHKVVSGALWYGRDRIDLRAPLIQPWAVVNQYAINDFSKFGNVSHISFKLEFGLVAGMALTLLICPTVFLFTWRKRRLERMKPGSERVVRPLDGSSLAYAFSGTVTLFLALSIVPVALIQESSYKSRCATDASQLMRYGIENELAWIGRDALQYRVIPKNLGGGGGSYAGYAIPEQLAKTDNGNFTSTVNADTLYIRGESAECATNVITHRLDKWANLVSVRYEGEWLGGG